MDPSDADKVRRIEERLQAEGLNPRRRIRPLSEALAREVLRRVRLSLGRPGPAIGVTTMIVSQVLDGKIV